MFEIGRGGKNRTLIYCFGDSRSTVELHPCIMAEVVRFELTCRSSRPTPFPGEPLRPLGYTSIWYSQLNALKMSRKTRFRMYHLGAPRHDTTQIEYCQGFPTELQCVCTDE